MRLMVRCAMLAATAIFVLSFYSRASGRDAMEAVESARHGAALGRDPRATVDYEVVTLPTNEGMSGPCIYLSFRRVGELVAGG